MKPKTEDKFMRRFPFLYRGKYKSMQETCMCWGFACGEGWREILWMLSLAIEDELKNMGYTKWKMRRLMFQEYMIKLWNKLIYKISPPKKWILGKGFDHDEYKGDILARFWEKRKPKNVPEKDIGKWLKRCCGFKRLIVFPPRGFEVVQVKEKYGTLRFYTSGVNDRIGKLISIAERASADTCERCGDYGKVRGGSWLVTLCAKHAKAAGHDIGDEYVG